MAKIYFVVVGLFLVVGSTRPHRHSPKFPKLEPEMENSLNKITQVACTNSRHKLLNENIEKSRCGAPKEVFVELTPPSKNVMVTPSHVWVKRCVGLCDFDASVTSNCIATSKHDIEITIRMHNTQTKKDNCATYKVEEHLSCGCCQLSPEDCGDRIFNPRKCSCQCPNNEERRSCLHKPNHRWNRAKCTCEIRRPRRRVQ